MKTDEHLQQELYELCKNRQGEWAKEHGFTRAYINAICNGKRPMTEEVAEILGYKRTKVWVRKTKAKK